MQVIYTLIAIVIGYFTFRLITTPNSKVYRKLPRIRIKNQQLFPNIRIAIRGKIFHFHHWFSFTILLCISIFVTHGLLDSWLMRGFLVGGVFQGLRFPDRNLFQRRPE